MFIKFLYIVFAYLCGSIPFAYIIAENVAKVDIRTAGSGNPGTTNVFRSVGKGAGIATFVADVLKGFIPVYFAKLIDNSSSYSVAVAVAAILGHIFTIFLKFKGGKGVATGLGVFLALMPLPSLLAFSIFGLVFMFSGYVAMGSICAAISLPLSFYFLGYGVEPIIFSFACAMLIVYKHKANIKRLKDGSENRFRIFKRR
ncbi:MAG: glycerol-3-phosphate 1-O-acyltransferase PlsY [Endomicrobium sp.]|nr:glycerol-3-phosphate 1-O-acyltransferase PlsY [Endomicrobium sp.]